MYACSQKLSVLNLDTMSNKFTFEEKLPGYFDNENLYKAIYGNNKGISHNIIFSRGDDIISTTLCVLHCVSDR